MKARPLMSDTIFVVLSQSYIAVALMKYYIFVKNASKGPTLLNVGHAFESKTIL